MLVTLPCVLLLLDYWPLKRLGENWTEIQQRLPRLMLEKLPLLIPVAAGRCADDSSGSSHTAGLAHSGDTAPGVSVGQWSGGLRDLSSQDGVAGGSGRVLPSSGNLAELVDCDAGGSLPGGHLLVGLAGQRIGLSRGGMALVSGNSDSRERPHPGRRPLHGRPPCLYPFNRCIHHADLGNHPGGSHSTTEESMAHCGRNLSAADHDRPDAPLSSNMRWSPPRTIIWPIPTWESFC